MPDEIEKLKKFSTCGCGKPLTAANLYARSTPGCQDNDSPPVNVAPSFALKNENNRPFIYILLIYIHSYILT